MAQDLDKAHYYERREIEYEITDFFKKEFLTASQTSANELDNLTRLLTLGIGFSRGSVNINLQENDIYNNPLLYYYFSTLTTATSRTYDDETNIKNNLALYNSTRKKYYPDFAHKHFTNNLVTALFLQKFAPTNSTTNYYLTAGYRSTGNIFKSDKYIKPSIAFRYQRLNRQSNLVRYLPSLVESTP